MIPSKTVHIGSIPVGGDSPHILIAGPCVIESEAIVLETATDIATIAQDLKIPYIFKASYDKANRTSISSFRGLGLGAGLNILRKVKKEVGVPILTDIHEVHDVAEVAEVEEVTIERHIEEPVAQPQQNTNRRKKRKPRRTSVVQIDQEDGSKYYYDDPSLGGTGATAWQRDELEVLNEGEEEDEGEEEKVKPVRTRRRSATAKTCIVDGCENSHRYPDGRCQLCRG